MIELRNISRTFENGGNLINALNGVSIKIAAGEYVAIMGHSGSGKSTLLNIMGCLDRQTSGQYLINGTETNVLDDDQRSEIRGKEIGFVFQRFHLLPRLSILENVLLPLRFHAAEPEGVREWAIELIDRVGLKNRINHLPHELSGGQMQRAALARALVVRPRLLLADEPTGNLDSNSALTVLSLINEFHREGQTVVMVTHNSEVAAGAERCITMRDGVVSYDSGGSRAAAIS